MEPSYGCMEDDPITKQPVYKGKGGPNVMFPSGEKLPKHTDLDLNAKRK